jgi:signal transduction histidine kinase
MKSIALKLWLGMMALVSVVLILLWFFQIVFLDRFYTEIRISDIKNESLQILKELEMGNQSQFEDNLDKLAYDNNLTAELLDAQNKTLYATGVTGASGQMPMMRNSARIEAYKKALAGQMVLQPLTHPRFGSNFMLIAIPASMSNGQKGALLINLPLVPVENTVDILKRQLLYISVILFVVALLLTFLLSRTFTRPILGITKVAQEMAGGNLGARIKPAGRDEIGRLAETINYMGHELAKIEQLRKDLIANVSHELRTPLSLIKGYAETIRDISGSIPEKREKQVNIIIEEADRLSNIVDDILNLSQMQAGYLNLQIDSFMLNDILDKVLKRFEILSEKTKVGLHSENAPGFSVEADETRIEQVLYNLINNAFNHSAPGGTINVATFEGTNKVRVTVSDTGKGIPEEEIKYIWDRFYKADKSGQRIISGTGLGLAIVKNILNAHKFTYGVESQVGLGTTFWFDLKKS